MDDLTDRPIRILLIEDNPADARLLSEDLREGPDPGFEVRHAVRLAEAAGHARAGEVDVVLLDLSLPDSQGLDTLSRALELFEDLAIVVLTGLADEQSALEAVRRGAQDYLVKGQISGRDLRRAIRYAVERRHFQRQREQLIGELQEALATVKRLSGLLPICAWCKKVRDDEGYWRQIDKYIHEHSEATFSHGICPQCAAQVASQMGDGEGEETECHTG